MSRLPRPHIPLGVRVKVAERQVVEQHEGRRPVFSESTSLSKRLRIMLDLLFGEGVKVELHHRPALVNRARKRNGDYDPPASDPDHLFYLPDDDHDIETRVRGLRGAHSDLGLRRKNKRIAKNRDPKRRKAKIRGRSQWPPRGSRKIQNRVKR